MKAGTTATTLTTKLPILNPGEYDLWLMRTEEYFLMTDYSLWEVINNAIEKRYRGNKESKKVQRTLLKQQYENFAASSSKTLDQTFDRLQKLISQLEFQGEVIEQEDINLKLLRSLPSEWKTYALILRNKAEIETISLDDVYNNLKIYEPELTGSSSTSQNPQNVAFVSFNSTISTNEADNTAYGISIAHTQGNTIKSTFVDSLSDVVICAFLASHPNSSQLAREDLKQIDLGGLEEIHFARECRAPKNQENRGREYGRKFVPVENPTKNALIAQDGIRGYDWSYQAEEEHPTNFALIALTSSGSSSNSDFEDKTGLGYRAAFPAIENFVNSSKMIEKQENVSAIKIVESQVDSIDVKNKGVCSAVETKHVKKNSFSHLIIEDWISDDESDVEFKPKVKDKNVRPRIEKIKFVKTARETEEMETNAILLIMKIIMVDLFPLEMVKVEYLEKDETSGILKTFITRIENQLDCKVKVIKCHNGTEFKNGIMNQFCDMKRIKREFSVAKTPQQNGVAERKNRTLIEAARTILVDFKLPTTFWAEAVNTACYVLNRALVIKPHNKTPYELIRGRPPLINFMKPFSKAMRVFNKRTKIVEETLNIRFLENAPSVKGMGPDWLFDIDYLTIFMKYVPVVAGFQTNGITKTKDNIVAGQAKKKKEPEQEYIMIPICITDPLISQGPKDSAVDAGKKAAKVDESQVLDNGG
nr:hypothetical protein [Tanacetum cinerariifolium]